MTCLAASTKKTFFRINEVQVNANTSQLEVQAAGICDYVGVPLLDGQLASGSSLLILVLNGAKY